MEPHNDECSSPEAASPATISAASLFKRASALMFDLRTLMNKLDHKNPGLVVWRSSTLLEELKREFGHNITDVLCKELTKRPSYGALLEGAVNAVCTVVNEQLVPSVVALRKQAGPSSCPHCGANPCPKYEKVEVLGVCEMFPTPIEDSSDHSCTHDLRPDPHLDTLACARLHLALYHIVEFCEIPDFEPILSSLLPTLGPLYTHMNLYGEQSQDAMSILAFEIANTEQVDHFGSGINGLMRGVLFLIQTALDHEIGYSKIENDDVVYAGLESATNIMWQVEETEIWHEILMGDPDLGGEIARFFLSVGCMTMYHTSVFACTQGDSLADALHYCCTETETENTVSMWFRVAMHLLSLLCDGNKSNEKDVARINKFPCLLPNGKETTFERAAAIHTDVLVFLASVENDESGSFVEIGLLHVLFPWLEVVQAGEKWRSYVYDIHTQELESRVLRSYDQPESEHLAGNNSKNGDSRNGHKSTKTDNSKSSGACGTALGNGACAQCGGVFGGLQVCGGCRLVAYCGRNCQKAHWRAGHKTECQPRGAASK